MGGVYGSFYEEFPELVERFHVWTAEDRSDERLITGIYISTKGSGIKRRKYTSGNTALDITDVDEIYISRKYDGQVKEGDYIQKISDNLIMRVTNNVPYDRAAGYRVYKVELVTGTTYDKDQPLKVKEATFA